MASRAGSGELQRGERRKRVPARMERGRLAPRACSRGGERAFPVVGWAEAEGKRSSPWQGRRAPVGMEGGGAGGARRALGGLETRPQGALEAWVGTFI